MRRKILLTLLLCILLTGFVYSQEGPPRGGPKEGKKLSVEEMVKMEMKMLKQELDLTETQATFIQKILEDSYKKMEENLKSGKKDRDEMEKIMQEKDNKLKDVLTDEQWTKYTEIKDRMKDKFKNKEKPPSGRERP